MAEEYYQQETKAPFNMAIATLMSLRYTLDRIRDIEGRIDYPAQERQRIKIELVKRFYVDSSPLLGPKVSEEYKAIIKIKPSVIINVNPSNQKEIRRTNFSWELNEQLDECLRSLQLALQKNKYFMPPSDDMGASVAKMS